MSASELSTEGKPRRRGATCVAQVATSMSSTPASSVSKRGRQLTVAKEKPGAQGWLAEASSRPGAAANACLGFSFRKCTTGQGVHFQPACLPKSLFGTIFR